MTSLWSGHHRALTAGMVLTITLVGFEALAIATVMPVVKDDLGGLGLYGWVFSGFFLSSLLGIVVAGRLADRLGLAVPFTVGLGLFAVGLAAGGAATSMGMLVAARVAQGFGAGTIPPIVYAAIGRGYEPEVRPKMFATISSAWVVPGLVGPAIAATVARHLSWRWVFLGLLPIVVVAAVMAIPALRALDVRSPAGREDLGGDVEHVRRGVLLVVGLGAVMVAGSGPSIVVAVVLVALGLPLAAWATRGLLPPGTFRLAPGVPATVAVRGLLTWSFFAADTYIALAVVDGRDSDTWIAAAALSIGSITWAAASWVQAKKIGVHGPRRLDQVGFLLIIAAIALMVGVAQGLPVLLAIPAWAVGCFGMGIAYSPLSVTVLAAAPPGEEGAASGALQLSDALGVAIGTGIGASIVHQFDARGWSVTASTTVVFLSALALGVVGLLAARRLPDHVPHPPIGYQSPAP